MEEKKVITLSNDGKYLLLHDLGEIDGIEGERFFFAMGVTPDYDLDTDDIIFLSTYKRNGQDIVKKVSEDSEVYKILSYLEVVTTAMDNIPGYKKQLEEEIEKLQRESSQ